MSTLGPVVGAVKLAPELPGEIDAIPPWVHIEQSFMHLGFHILDVGFQSPNSEAAKAMVFTTTLLLITIVFVLNLAAIYLRSQWRNRSRPHWSRRADLADGWVMVLPQQISRQEGDRSAFGPYAGLARFELEVMLGQVVQQLDVPENRTAEVEAENAKLKGEEDLFTKP